MEHVPATEAIRGEWLRRIEAEYRSATITQHLTLWMMQIGASPDLIRAGLRIAEDELTHAELSHECYALAGGTEAPSLGRETLGLKQNMSNPLEWDVTRIVGEVFCLGETIAVPLFKRLREGTTVPCARKALDRILVDEVRHRDFGWTSLEWLFEQPCADDLRALVTRELPHWFAQSRNNYQRATSTVVSEADRAWGLMPPSEYAACFDRTFERDWKPRFANLGIDAELAWLKQTTR
jgi:hypothetical protein